VRFLARAIVLLLVCALIGLGALLLVLSLQTVVAVAAGVMVVVVLWRMNRRHGGKRSLSPGGRACSYACPDARHSAATACSWSRTPPGVDRPSRWVSSTSHTRRAGAER
jgi:hypothetical protein